MEKALCPVLVGREGELTALEDALLAANRGEGQIILLAGEAGLGKSRLATELQKRALRIGMTVLWGGCSEADLSLPYLPFLEAIGNYLATTDLEAVKQQLGPVRAELARLFPQLDAEATHDQGDATQAKLRLFEALMALLRIPASAQGVLLVIEDLHWSDASTRELLDYLARRTAGMRMLILGTYRLDELHRKHPLAPIIQGWRRTRAASVIELQPLPLKGVGDMVAAIFDTNEITAEFAELLYGRSEGNPFVLEEFLKAAMDRGDIYRTPERWERKNLADLRLPRTVRDTILLRVERLSDEQADLLQTAAVLGPAWDYRSLVALSGKDESTVQAALQASLQQQLLEEDPGGRGRYRFRHALTRESIYEDMIVPRREQLHARAAEMLAKMPGTPAVELAYHLSAANRWSDAIPIGFKAGEEAERNWAYRDAAKLYERLLPHVSDELTRGQLLCRIGDAYFNDVDPGRAQRYLEEGIPLLEGAGRPREAARYRMVLGRIFWERSEPKVAMATYERARIELEAEGPSPELATAYIRLAGLAMFDLDYENCLRLATKAAEVAQAAADQPTTIWARLFIGGALVALNRADEGFALMDQSHHEALARGLLWIARNALHNTIVMRQFHLRAAEAKAMLPLFDKLPKDFFTPFDHGGVWLCLGYPTKARAFLEEALTMANESGSSTAANWIRRSLATTLAQLGFVDDALGHLHPESVQQELQDLRPLREIRMQILIEAGRKQEALAVAMSIFDRARWGALHERRQFFDVATEVFVANQKVAEAERLLETTAAEPPLGDPYQLRAEGRVALARGDVAGAHDRLRAALTRFVEADYGIEIMRTRRVLAEAALAAGNRAEAEEQLRLVVEMADARGATQQGRLAQARLAELGVPLTASPASPVAAAEAVGERLVTVLFLDIRGYTPMTARESPERLVDTVSSLYRWARQEIERHHGMVDRYEGDAVMATFNATGARLDHCLQALQAAIAIRDKAAASALPVGGAIAVGPAVVGRLTSTSQVSTFGEVTNLAARLQAQAQPGEILLSEEAYRRTREWLAEREIIVERESLDLKGFAEPVAAFRLKATSALRPRR